LLFQPRLLAEDVPTVSRSWWWEKEVPDFEDVFHGVIVF